MDAEFDEHVFKRLTDSSPGTEGYELPLALKNDNTVVLAFVYGEFVNIFIYFYFCFFFLIWKMCIE